MSAFFSMKIETNDKRAMKYVKETVFSRLTNIELEIFFVAIIVEPTESLKPLSQWANQN